jgi:predicted transposase/invertase (TIGR01784 family)
MAVQLSQAYLEWEQKTKEEGRLEGRVEGRAEGEQIGAVRGKLEAARNFLRLGVAPEVVAKAAGISLEEVQQLQQAQP